MGANKLGVVVPFPREGAIRSVTNLRDKPRLPTAAEKLLSAIDQASARCYFEMEEITRRLFDLAAGIEKDHAK